MDTIKYITSEAEWQNTLKEFERKSFESHAHLIGLIAKYKHLAKNSIGLSQEIYKKELKKLNTKLKGKSL